MPSYSDHRPAASDGLYPPSRHRNGPRSREHSPDPSRLRPDPRYYSSRYGSSPRPSSRTPSENRRVNPPNPPVKRTWPPAPAVEDEKASLAKEAYGPKIADSDKSEALSRGSVDQQPIILDVENPLRAATDEGDNFARAPKESLDPSQRGRRNTADGALELPETPIFMRRAPSPYAFMPKAPDFSKTQSIDSGYFSAEPKSSTAGTPLSEKRMGYALPPDMNHSSALRGNGKSRNTFDNDPQEVADPHSVVDDDLESSVSSRGSRAPAPYSFVKPSSQDKDVTPAVRDFAKAEPQPRLAEIKAEALQGRRRDSDPTSTSTRPQLDDASRSPGVARSIRRDIPAPIITAAAAATAGAFAGDSLGAGLSQHSSGSRPSSPISGSYAYSTSPPRSPRSSAYQFKTESPKSARSSVSGSVSGSRPSSPVPNYAQSFVAPRAEEGMRRSSTFPLVLEDRSQRTSRLASSSIHVDDNPNSPIPGRAPSSLPYPVDDMNLMPSEEDHRYKPRALGDPFVSRPSTRDGPVDSPINSRPNSLEVPVSRPRTNVRHSLNGDLPTLATVTAAAAATRAGPDSPSTPRASSGTIEKPRARCMVVQSSRNFQDWYKLGGSSSLDVCPSCFETHIAPSHFNASFQKFPRNQADSNVKCSFRTPWYKLAWQLTQQQQRFDLELLYAVARVDDAENVCPGASRDNRPWHTIYDKRGEAVHGFDICPCDVKKIEVLMPTLRGAFEESHNSGRRRRCNLRVESMRCLEYLDELRLIDEAAAKKRKTADMASFIELARNKAQMRECSRDDLVVDKEWHFAPHLPEFTVCEECYSSVVWPAIADGSAVASRFKRTPELVYEEKETDSRASRRGTAAVVAGTSCQLYSPRMRRVFRKAAQSGDFAYLATRAKERKEVEMELQAKFARLQAVGKEWEKASAKSGDRRSVQSQQRQAELMADFEKITDEWRKWE